MTPRRPNPDQHFMAFGDHLDELRRRLVFALLGPIPLFIVCLIFGATLLDVLLVPLEHALRAAGMPTKLLATSPAEPVAAYMKLATVVALLASGPWILWQAWLFVSPGLYAHEKRFAYFLIPLSALLTTVGTLFLYFVLLPVSLRFLIAFGAAIAQSTPTVAPLAPGIVLPSAPVLAADPPEPAPGQYWVNTDLQQWRIAVGVAEGKARILGMALQGDAVIVQQYRVSEYVNLVFILGLVFALAFQLPVVLLLLGWSGIVSPDALTKKRRHVLFGCIVASAVLTPTVDPWTLMLLAGPLYGLFELGIAMMRFVPARRVARGIGGRGGRGGAPAESHTDGHEGEE